MIFNILIIGYGFVGKSIEHIFKNSRKAEFNITILDPAKGLVPVFNIADQSAIFICVGTPQSTNGSCNDQALLECMYKVAEATCPVIIKSTAPPSVIRRLMDIKRDLVYYPEFLREKHWEYDSLHPDFIVLGTVSAEKFKTVSDLLHLSKIEDSKSVKILNVHPVQASLYKYAANTFLATKVVYMHELYKWMVSDGMEMHWHALVGLMSLDSRLGTSHLIAPGDHGLGYSGTCFPKDMEALLYESENQLHLIEAAINVNKELRNP